MKKMCTVLLSGLLISCLCIGCSNTNNATNESTDRLEKTIKEEESSGDTTIINNYNDNSTTNNNNTTNNYYNTDTEEEEKQSDDDDYVVKVYVTEGRIVDDEESGSEYREYKDYSDNNDCDNDYDCDNTITPIGDIKNDMDPDPNVVHIKNIKCPNCGKYFYIEHYNLKDENLTFYMGVCNSCGYER